MEGFERAAGCSRQAQECGDRRGGQPLDPLVVPSDQDRSTGNNVTGSRRIGEHDHAKSSMEKSPRTRVCEGELACHLGSSLATRSAPVRAAFAFIVAPTWARTSVRRSDRSMGHRRGFSPKRFRRLIPTDNQKLTKRNNCGRAETPRKKIHQPLAKQQIFIEVAPTTETTLLWDQARGKR